MVLEPLTTHPDEWAEPSHTQLAPALPHRHPNLPSPPATPLRSQEGWQIIKKNEGNKVAYHIRKIVDNGP